MTRAALAALVASAWIAGCAPHRVAPTDLGSQERRLRFERGLASRSARPACEAMLSAWARAEWLPDLPGVQARLLLDAPDAFRFKVASLFGTAIDVAARGEKFTAYVPARRAVLETEAAAESLGVAAPGALGYRVWSATWRPAAGAWNTASREDSLVVLAWRDGDERIRLAVGSSGLPAWVEWARGGGAMARAHYDAWRSWSGTWWPATLIVEDSTRSMEVTCRVDQVRFPSALTEAQLTIQVPAGAERVSRSSLRRTIERLGRP